jgi:hypothetical protein
MNYFSLSSLPALVERTDVCFIGVAIVAASKLANYSYFHVTYTTRYLNEY